MYSYVELNCRKCDMVGIVIRVILRNEIVGIIFKLLFISL